MRVFASALCAAAALLLPLASVASVHPHHRSSTHAMVRHSSASRANRSEHVSFEHAPPTMSSERAAEIQAALIKQGYLSGEPTGSWDAASIADMQKLQSDNDWQTKLVPDSRALIKLGLGPGARPVPPPSSTALTGAVAGFASPTS